MGRMLKNYKMHTGSHAVQLPDGSVSLDPQSPQNGQLRHNILTQTVQVYYTSPTPAWQDLGTQMAISMDLFAGNGIAQTFTMSKSYSVGQDKQVLVFIGGIYQQPQQGIYAGSYSVSGTTITFTSPPPAYTPPAPPENIVILHNA